ncbi:MAG: Uma2 family endonuclease [Chloroflexota bacterium]|nr:Uma2 family endonuclease [Chloroflexota bacterium]
MVISKDVTLEKYRRVLKGVKTDDWPRDIEEAAQRPLGPYTLENSLELIEEKPIELYNGWLVWKEMTDPEERRVATIMLEILSSTARTYNFGQGYMDLFECKMATKELLIPDVSIVSTQRFESQIGPAIPGKKQLVLNGSPELVIEVRSPSNLRHEERTKRQKYFENGTLVIWDVEPKKRKIWLYEVENPKVFTEYGPKDTISCERLFPSWRRLVGDFFSKELTAEDIVGQAAKEWRAESEAKGEAKGEARGRAEGELGALRRVLLIQAALRFKAEKLPTDLEVRLMGYTVAQLITLVNTIATSLTLEEWLDTFPT